MIFFNISAFFFSYFSVTAIYVIFLPKMLQMVGYSPMQIGIVLAMAPLMRFLVPFLFLKHIQLSKKVFQNSLITILVSAFLFYPTIEHFYLFLFPNLFIGAALGLILPYIETYAMEHLGKERFGRSRLFGSLGFMLTGIILARDLDAYITGVHAYIVSVIVVVFFGFLLSKDKNAISNRQNISDEKFSLSKVTFIWISLFFMQISFGAFYSFFTIYETQRGISLETVSYLWAFGVICEILFFYFQAPLLKLNLVNILKFSVLITILRWLLLFAFPSSLAISFLSQSLHAISFALHHTAAISLLYSVYANKKLAAQFYYGFSFGLGGFLGAIIAGFFYGPYLYAYAALMALCSLVALFFYKPKTTVLVQNP